MYIKNNDLNEKFDEFLNKNYERTPKIDDVYTIWSEKISRELKEQENQEKKSRSWYNYN